VKCLQDEEKNYFFLCGHVFDELLEDVAGKRKFVELEDSFLDFKRRQVQVLEQDHCQKERNKETKI